MRSAMSPGCSTRACGVTDDPGDEHLPLGQLHLLEDMVFVFVAWVGCFKRIGSGVDLQHDIDNILQGHFMDAWTDIDAVAGMKAHLFRWDVADRVIDGFDALGCPASAVGHAAFRMHHIVGDQTRVVDLQDEARVNDRVVLLTEGIAEGLLILFGAPIGTRSARWRRCRTSNGRQKDFCMW